MFFVVGKGESLNEKRITNTGNDNFDNGCMYFAADSECVYTKGYDSKAV
jgi:hypothetical protein